MPEFRPSCGAKLSPAKEGDKDIRCPNVKSCPAQLTERVISLASRKAFDIEHLGEQSAIALTYPEENRPDSVATYAPNITEVLVAPAKSLTRTSRWKGWNCRPRRSRCCLTNPGCST